MRGVNKQIIIGNISQDPELKVSQGGNPITTLGVATQEEWKDGNGVKQKDVTFHNCVFFGKLAEIVNEYAEKGKKVYIEGTTKNRRWQDKEGSQRNKTEVVGKEFQLLDRKNEQPVDNSTKTYPSEDPWF